MKRRRSHHGFTLVELMVSVAIIGVLMTAIGSSILLASKAIPDATAPASRLMSAAGIASDLAAELRQATCITEYGTAAITFAVPDRDDDGSPERIRYAWDQDAGVLTRSYNSGPDVRVLTSVHQFNLDYTTSERTEQFPGPPVWSSIQTLSQNTSSYGGQGRQINYDHWVGQAVRPSLPSDAVYYQVTSASLVVKGGLLSAGWMHYRIYQADEQLRPTGSHLQQASYYNGWLSSLGYEWVTLDFSDPQIISAAEPMCLVAAGGSSATADVFSDVDVASGRLRTSNSGGSWDVDTKESTPHYVFGRVATPGPTRTLTRRFITGIDVTLENSDTLGQPVRTAVMLFNAPEVLSTFWACDFERHPGADRNIDGEPDWHRRDGLGFNSASIQNGVWNVDAILDTGPENDFAEPTTVDVRFRDTTVGGDGAMIHVNADRAGTQSAPIAAALALQSDGTQKLSVYMRSAGASRTKIADVRGLSSDFVHLRLIIDPAVDAVHVQVNGDAIATGAYEFSGLDDHRTLALLESGSEAEFDDVKVRVGGKIR